VDQPVPFDGSPYAISIGVRRLDLENWLDLDSRTELLAQKLPLLQSHHAEVVATIPGSEVGAEEVLGLVQAELQRHGIDEDSQSTSDRSSLHPIDRAGRLVGEDLCLMEQRPELGTGYFLTAGSVCFPSRWVLSEKIGTSLDAIHAPVPGFESIAEATNRFFDAITIDRPAQRVNWTLIDDETLFQPVSAGRARDRTMDPSRIGETLHLRIERQTLRRLPDTGGVLFTIGTTVSPLTALSWAQRKDLAGSLAEVGEQTQAYKGWVGVIPRLLTWAESGS
jgi:hypothetical protein